jgi:sugar lactone lactonase YvrE
MALLGCGDDDAVPHADAGTDAGPPSGACLLDAAALPTPTPGRCAATVAPGAELKVGDDGAGGFITPGGRRVTRVGTQVVIPGFPMRVVAVPGTSFVVVMDAGIREEHLSVVDVRTGAVVSEVEFAYSPSEAVFLGMVVSEDGRRLWASGGGTSRVWAYDLDPSTGAITPAPSRDIEVARTAREGYVAGMARVVPGSFAVNLLLGDATVVFDADDGRELARYAFEDGSLPYDVVASPGGAHLYVSLWARGQVVDIDLREGRERGRIDLPRKPQGLALSPDGSTLAVASSDADVVTLVDVGTWMVRQTIPVVALDAPRGSSPSSVAFGPDGRLYSVCAGDNAIDVFAPTGPSMPFVRVGRVPTMWYPTDVLVLADGTLLYTNGKHVGTGPNTDPARVDILELLSGSLSILAPGSYDDARLAEWELEIASNNDRMRRFVGVDCPEGAPYDFPIPSPGMGPSTKIRHVIVVVRENKTYDAYLGGLPGGDGDPTLTIMPAPMLEDVIPNTLALARTFAHSDNYYSGAEQSVQGHVWTTLGRTTDFVERTWLTTWGRGYWGIPPQLTVEYGYPEEGSIFDWLERVGVSATNYGEIVGSRNNAPARGYPGVVYNTGVLDRLKAEFLRGRWQDRCELRSFTYVVLPNDHTEGGRAGAPTPASMIADNDEGVGILADALSHSSFWPESLLVFIQDDPQDGGDHVDNHRAPAIFVSPWVRRGHVSHVHVNESSLYRTLQLILGVPAPLNAYWENAAPLYDLFTSTPDYTPYERIPRRWPEETNPASGRAAAISAQWDFSRPDQQPGLSRFLWEYFHPGQRAPWPDLPPPPHDADDD